MKTTADLIKALENYDERGARVDQKQLALALAKLYGVDAIKPEERRTRAVEYCRRLRDDVAAVAPNGPGDDPETLRTILKASNFYLDQLAYWRDSGNLEVGASLKPGGELYNRVVSAWRKAGRV